MTTYYIITQSDTDEVGHIVYPNSVVRDGAGVPELYISAEEARETIARDVANNCGCDYGPSFSINAESEYSFKSWNEAYTKVMQEMQAESGQYLVIRYRDGSERNYTINEVKV